MNIITVPCTHCQQENRAVLMPDGTYMTACTNKECKKFMVARYLILTRCRVCKSSIAAYEQETLLVSRHLRIFNATCWTKGCTKFGHTFSVTPEAATS